MRRSFATAGLFLGSVAVTLGVLEAGARRFADPTGGYDDILAQAAQARAMSVHEKSDDPELVYVTRPGYVTNGVRISEAHGILRATDVPEAKPAGSFRIAVLGDSIAAAHPIRVGGAPAFSDVLEQTLNARPGAPTVEALNFGTDGYSTLQEARLLETRAARFAPDLVLVAYCLNDPANSYTPTVWFLEDRAPRSYLLDLVRRRLHWTPSELSPAHPRYTHSTIDWERLYIRMGPQWRSVEAGMARIADYASAHHVPGVLVLFPFLFTGREPAAEVAQAEQLYAQVTEAARHDGFSVIDLRSTFAAAKGAELRLFPEDPLHPNALGHRLAGEAAAAELAAAHLVP